MPVFQRPSPYAILGPYIERINVAFSSRDGAVITDIKRIKWYDAGVATSNTAALRSLAKAGKPTSKLNSGCGYTQTVLRHRNFFLSLKKESS